MNPYAFKNTPESNADGKFFGCTENPLSDWDEEVNIKVLPSEEKAEEDDERQFPWDVVGKHGPCVSLSLRCMDHMLAVAYDFETWDKIVAYVAAKRAEGSIK